jgi:uncharacterized MAPEG superfamily protein
MKYSPELYALTIISAATAIMWVPYVLARLATRGLAAIANVDPGVPPDPAWADRARRAHGNAVENLVVFAPIVLTAAMIGVSTQATVVASQVYVAARLAHYALFVAGVPYLRTAAFFVGVIAILVIAVTVLDHAA